MSKYGVGVTTGGSSFVEANYFRNCKYPMLISKQGTDAEGDGTFSGEPGGVIKAYNNKMDNPRKIQYYTEGQTNGKWDAVKVSDRDATVTATAYAGGTSYNNEADQQARTTYVENKMDNPADVKAIVKGAYGAGRMQHGDFKWSFKNAAQDENYGVVAELKTALQNYLSLNERRATSGHTHTIFRHAIKVVVIDMIESGTGIHQVMNDESQITNDVYDLMGRRIAIPQTGKIYILHGSKVVFK